MEKLFLLFLMICQCYLFTQQVTISGYVEDVQTGERLIEQDGTWRKEILKRISFKIIQPLQN